MWYMQVSSILHVQPKIGICYHYLPKKYIGHCIWYPVYLVDNIPWIHCELSQPTVCGLVLIAIERGKLKLWQARIGGVALSLLQVIPATWNRATLELQSILPYLSLYYQRLCSCIIGLYWSFSCVLCVDWGVQLSTKHPLRIDGVGVPPHTFLTTLRS